MRNFGIWNDENQQARVVESPLVYKNKLVDEWESLNIRRIELNITRISPNNEPQVVYSGVYNGVETTKINWIEKLMFKVTDLGNNSLRTWADVAQLKVMKMIFSQNSFKQL